MLIHRSRFLRALTAIIAVCFFVASAAAQGTIETSLLKKKKYPCPSPKGEADFEIEIDADASIVQAGSNVLGVYVQDVSEEWTICSTCGWGVSIYNEVLELWISIITFQNCVDHDTEYVEYYIVNVPPGGGTNVKLTDSFNLNGDDKGKKNRKEADNKKFIGSGAPGFAALLGELIDANETTSYVATIRGAKRRVNVLVTDELPPHQQDPAAHGPGNGAIVTYGAMAAASPPQALTDFVNDSNNAAFIIGGDPHWAKLTWICCYVQHVSFYAQAE